MTDWPVKTFGDLFDSKPKSSESLKQKDYLSTGKFPVVDQGQELIGGFTNDQHLVRDFETPVIVFGDHTRCVKYVDFPFASGADGTKILIPIKGVDPKYAYFQLLSIELPTKGYARHFGELSKRSFVLPPLVEQKRIVALLDAATARVTELTACYEQARTHTNDLFVSALTELFKNCAADEMARQLTIGEICEIGDGNHSAKYPKSTEFVANGIPFIRANNIANGKISSIDMRFISEKKHNELKKGHLKTGDVLITNRGEIGTLAIVNSEFDGSNLNSQIAWLRVSNLAINRYLYYFLSSPNANTQFFQGTTGAALQQLTISTLKKIKVPIVPLRKQVVLTDRLDKLKKGSSEIIASYDAKLVAAKNLRQSILESAFAGEL